MGQGCSGRRHAERSPHQPRPSNINGPSDNNNNGSSDSDDLLAIINDDEKMEATRSTPLPSVEYGPGLEYDLCLPRLVKDPDGAPLGTYDILLNDTGTRYGLHNAAGCINDGYRKYLTTIGIGEQSLLVTREGDGRIKFQLVWHAKWGDDIMCWACFSDARIDYESYRETRCMRISSPRLPYPNLDERYGAVRFVYRRGATFYAGEERDGRKGRCPPAASVSHAEEKLADFARLRNGNGDDRWIHRRLGLPVEVAAEVRGFLATPGPPPVFFFEMGDLLLDIHGDDERLHCIYLARKARARSSPPEKDSSR